MLYRYRLSSFTCQEPVLMKLMLTVKQEHIGTINDLVNEVVRVGARVIAIHPALGLIEVSADEQTLEFLKPINRIESIESVADDIEIAPPESAIQ